MQIAGTAALLVCIGFAYALFATNNWRGAALLIPACAVTLALLEELQSSAPLIVALGALALLYLLWMLGPQRVHAWAQDGPFRLPGAAYALIAVAAAAVCAALEWAARPITVGAVSVIALLILYSTVIFVLWGFYTRVIVALFVRDTQPRAGKLLSCGTSAVLIPRGRRRRYFGPSRTLARFQGDENTYSVSRVCRKLLKGHIGERFSYTVCTGLHGRQFLRALPVREGLGQNP